MGVVPENAFLSRGAEPAATGTASAPALRPAGDPLNYDDLLREYNLLRERSGRTTNALASAAHDLKTPPSQCQRKMQLNGNGRAKPCTPKRFIARG